jgi:serine/threonine-protein kinase
MAPEQVTGRRDPTDRVDVYAVGVLLFQMLTGKYPFEDTATARGIAHEHISVAPPDARTLEPSVPAVLAELVAECLKKDPTARPAAAELARRLTAFGDQHAAPTLDKLELAGALCDLDLARAWSAPTVAARSQRPA